MKSLTKVGRWRLTALVLIAVALAVVIPTAFGAGSAATKMTPQLQRQSRLVVAPSVLRHAPAMMKSMGNATCAGGSIAPGKYVSLKITGFCTVDQGPVKVWHNVLVEPNAGLIAAFGNGPQLAIGGNLWAERNSVLVLGCEPEAFTCINDPDQVVGTLSSKTTVFGNLQATNALAVIIHNSSIGNSLKIHHGGGGYNCDPQSAIFGSPAYATVEDTTVGNNATVSDLQTCWLGFFRTTVGGQLKYRNNSTFDPDGNEVDTNVVQGDLRCWDNNPAPQVGDSGGFPNITFHEAAGQCAGIAGP
jgi:hypothetical protein